MEMQKLLARAFGRKKHRKTTVDDRLRSYGAPLYPKPKAFLKIPEWMDVCRPLPSLEDLTAAAELRRRFSFPGEPAPYMHDIIRAFRLLKNAKTYLEVGIFDRGNLAYVSGLLADDALLIGVDIRSNEAQDAKLRSVLKPGQAYVSIVGDSLDPSTVAKVHEALAGRPLDGSFIDGDHTAYGAMSDYVNYGELVTAGGFVLFHDSVWEGDKRVKGVTDALAEIDKLEPVYLVTGDGSCHRFMRPLFRDQFWGVVGVLRAS